MPSQTLDAGADTSKHVYNARTLTPEQFITSEALGYLIMKVGDATSIAPPRRVEDHFEVDVFLSYEDTQLGRLAFTHDGVLIPELSSTIDEMQMAADAS